MAKCIYICSRELLSDLVKKFLHTICNKITPDNILAAEPKTMVDGCIAYGIMNPAKTLLEKGNSLLLGQIFGKTENWDVPLSEFPDGSYALFRDGKEHCEIVSDAVASRTVWYYKNENIFIASTSQRAITIFLGSFEFDNRIIPWMLSTGSLGPGFSWDKRIKRIPPDSSIILNKVDWSISFKSTPIEFNIAKRSDEEHKKLLTEALNTTFQTLDLDYSNWALPLSGGYDSRGILCLLSANTNVQHLRTVTWGLESAIHIKGNDAYVAKELAKKLNVSHRYYHTDLSDEPVERIINRFVLLGEGRIDHLAAYTDGFKIWKTLFEDGITGTIRGDESFGWLRASSAAGARISLGCGLCSDFSNLKDYKKYGFASQEIPQYINPRQGETLGTWRDRLYQEYRTPTFLAALADLKFPYVEQISPFYSKKVLGVARQLPDHLRTEKILFKKIVRSNGPKIDFATREATGLPDDILKRTQFVEFLRNELSSDHAKTLLPTEFLESVLKGIRIETEEKLVKANSFSIRSFAKKNLPRFLIRGMRKFAPPTVDPNILAFRVFLISKMNEILNEDCLIRKDVNYSKVS
jgi:hypothetical protein